VDTGGRVRAARECAGPDGAGGVRATGGAGRCAEGKPSRREGDAAGGGRGQDAAEFETLVSTHALLDRFYISRIGIRVLIGQFLSLR